MVITTSSGGVSVVNTGGADEDVVASLNALGNTFKDLGKGLLHMKGSTDYAEMNQQFAVVVKAVAEGNAKDKAAAKIAMKKDSEEFWGWIKYGGRGGQGRTLVEYREMRKREAEQTVPKNKFTYDPTSRTIK